MKKALGDTCVTIHHIGSTSIPALAAKPITDMVPVVNSLTSGDSANDKMRALGHDIKGEFGFLLRRFFTKENQFHIHNIGSSIGFWSQKSLKNGRIIVKII